MLRTKIICTLGPSSEEPSVIDGLVRGGMDVARLNMAHGESAQHRKLVEAVRRSSEELGRPVAVLADLSGPKIRIGRMKAPRLLSAGQRVEMAFAAHVAESQIPTTYEELAEDVEAGVRVAVDDGLIELECEKVEGDTVTFRVVRGGVVRSNQGVNIPSGRLSAASLTEKDLEDLEFALDLGVEYVGLSFVRSPSDVADLKRRVAGRALVVAKIEMARALLAIDAIIDVADMVMIARGDLGVELPYEELPLAQKRIIQKANFHARPVITATQMLESMIEHPRPTRAEASDVANAVLDGTDAVMLSGETAMGEYPLLALEAISRILREIEGSGVLASGPRYLGQPTHEDRGGATRREHAVAIATVDAVRHLRAPAVLVLTSSGFSARLVSSHRPPVPIFAVTTQARTCAQLSAVWGVRPVPVSGGEVSYESLTAVGKEAILKAGVGASGDSIVVTAGFPFDRPGTTNTLSVERLGS